MRSARGRSEEGPGKETNQVRVKRTMTERVGGRDRELHALK